MSKIFGVVFLNRDKKIKSAFSKMNKSFYFSNTMSHHLWYGDNIALGHHTNGAINTEQQPIVIQKKGLIMVFAGHLIDYELEKISLMQSGYTFSYENNDAEFLLNFIAKYGFRKLMKLNGIFTAAIWNLKSRELTIINDRYGMKPLYYYLKENRYFIFSSELKPILQSGIVDNKANWVAWNVFLRLDYLIGDITFFKNVFRIPPASTLSFDNTGLLSNKQYWDLNDINNVLEKNCDKIISNSYELLRNSIKKTIPKIDNSVWVTLSGGHDTRWIAAELKNQNILFKAFTTRKFNQYVDDIEISKLVSNKLSIEHEIVDLPRNFLDTYELLKNKIMDYESDENIYLYPMVKTVPGKFKICFDGTGDLVINSIFLNEKSNLLEKQGKYRTIAKNIIRKRGLGYLRQFNNYIFRLNIDRHLSSEEFAIDLVEQELLKYKDYKDPITAFYLFNRVRREIGLAPSNVFIGKSETFSPYLENEFFDYLMFQQPMLKSDRFVLHEVLKRYYPDLSNIPYTHFLDDNSQKKYFNDSLNFRKQLRKFCYDSVKKINNCKIKWISPFYFALVKFLFFLEGSPFKVNFFVNQFINHSIRKYPFERYFVSFSIIRMLTMLNDWINEYDIEIK